VKRWVPDVQTVDGMVREFALQMLRRLQKRHAEEQKRVDVQMNGEENMEDGQLPAEDLVQTPYLPEHIELPAQKAHVLQHVELLFALSVKVPEFLDEYVILRIVKSSWLTYIAIEYSAHMAKWKYRFRRQYKS
jgi:symplekin